MLKFLVFDENGSSENRVPPNAYLIGPDGHAMSADIVAVEGMLIVQKREPTVSALALQQRVGYCGELTVQTCLLPERDEPYLLSLELARHQLKTFYAKLEDWALFDLSPDHAAMRRAELARQLFISALCICPDDMAKADQLAKNSLYSAVDGSEELALAHAELLLQHRKANGMLPKNLVGCRVVTKHDSPKIRSCLTDAFDFLSLPIPWRDLAPEEGEYDWDELDEWIEWAHHHDIHLMVGPLISFEPDHLPDWLYIWEHDYDTVRHLIYDHIQCVIDRYRENIFTWNVVSGLHVNKHFTFTFEQIMDLTRMATTCVKEMQPSAKTIVEIQQPFGEYYSTNPRSIPPLMYANLSVQSGIQFDVLSIKLLMGQATAGQYVRDLMQISNLLDLFSLFGKPLHLTAAMPSDPVTPMMIASPDLNVPIDANCGYWHQPSSPAVQSHWLEALLLIATSRPYVKSVTWHELMDHPDIELPLAGLISENLQPKLSFLRAINFRTSLLDQDSKSAAAPTTSAGVASDPNLPPFASKRI